MINSFIWIKILLLITFRIQEKFLKSMINCFNWGKEPIRDVDPAPIYNKQRNTLYILEILWDEWHLISFQTWMSEHIILWNHTEILLTVFRLPNWLLYCRYRYRVGIGCHRCIQGYWYLLCRHLSSQNCCSTHRLFGIGSHSNIS